MTNSLIEIPKLKFCEPRHNLPGRKGVATAEDLFTIAFMRAYLYHAPDIHCRSRKTKLAFAREIPVNGYGIADLHVVAWEELPGEMFCSTQAFVRVTHPCTRAFECKLTDWRKAMAQAARYCFFANQAFVILPEEVCKHALPFLETFRKVKVGLWSFSPENNRIRVHHTPRAKAPKSDRYYFHAIDIVAKASSQSLPIL